MLTEARLFDKDNLLRLNNPANFQNTMNVTGACYVPSSWTTDLGNEEVLATHKPSYFSGYVFRGDFRSPIEILESGFSIAAPVSQGRDLDRVVSGAMGGYTGHYGVSTSICVSATTKYATRTYFCLDAHASIFNGYIYLIDAVHFKGFAIPSPLSNDSITIRFPHLREVYEVNFPHLIPNFKIVGIVYLSRHDFSPWPDYPSKLFLAVNPYYSASFVYGHQKTGMEAAKVVADRFNVKHGCVVV
ncbi:hypothetical protein [Endozoicomonas euniceicola]|uniref:Uncharacterized protein n=1 Tax=Endozoicomonas euniceicola TaxID=1234143 RepID=A0ABY6GRX0_9GAMM|nr:hypothetical protein [Endozoicomonas euniceicola]UYM14891.1 hypothetical protein NX720_18650 [Endozoicomonas euniceicola]